MTVLMVIASAWALLAVLGLGFMAALGRAAARGDAAVAAPRAAGEQPPYASPKLTAPRRRAAA